jgi:hypothetical protein
MVPNVMMMFMREDDGEVYDHGSDEYITICEEDKNVNYRYVGMSLMNTNTNFDIIGKDIACIITLNYDQNSSK